MPVVATVLDIIPLLLPEYRGGPAVRAYMRLVARAARRAAHVIALSDASRGDIICLTACEAPVRRLAAGHHPLARLPARAGDNYPAGGRPAVPAERSRAGGRACGPA